MKSGEGTTQQCSASCKRRTRLIVFSVAPSHDDGYFWDLVGVRSLGSALDYAGLIKAKHARGKKDFGIPE